jgi:UrcA family protein
VLAGVVDETKVLAGAEETRSVRIQFTRSALASVEERAALQHRIERAAKHVCGPLGAREAGGLRLAARNRQCFTNAVESALSQLEVEKLAALN